MKLRHLLPALAFSAVLAPAARAADAADSAAALKALPFEFTSTGAPVIYDGKTKEAVATGGGRLVYGDIILTADELRFSQATRVATAKGNVVLTRGELRFVADAGTYSLTDEKLTLTNPRLGRYPMYLSGGELSGTIGEFTISDATLALGEPGSFRPTIHATTVTIRPKEDYKATGARFRLGPIPILALPHFSQNLGEAPFTSSVHLGYRSSLGPYVDVTALAPLNPGVRVGAELGLYGKRGALIGPAAKYDTRNDGAGTGAVGELRTGWIHDFGDRGTDKYNREIDANRGYIEWKHQQTSGEHVTVTGQFNYWSDSEITRDFRKGSFENIQEPDSFLEANYDGRDWALGAFARVSPNDFSIVTQREPELRFDLFPSSLGGGVLQRASASYVKLREKLPITGTVLEGQRLDAFYGLSRPWAASPWLTFTPVVGGRMTHYFDALGAKDTYTRWVGEVGADLRARAYGTFELKNETWQIDGLRHLVEPYVQYRYLPGAERGTAYIPPIDREVFDTRLRPLELGDIRFLDTLHERNTVRLGLDQRLQTRDRDGGSRDLIVLGLAQDYRIRRLGGEDADSDLHADLSLRPAPWVRFDFYQRFALDDHQLKEFNSQLTFRDAEFWSVTFGTQFLRGDLEEYQLATQVRLNERFTVTGRWRYDSMVNTLYEQSYGLRQNFGHLWNAEYQLAWYEGVRRESKFHFRVLLDVVTF